MKQGTQSGARYLDTENGTFQNVVYWTKDPLDKETLAVLRRVELATQGFREDRLNVAYLVSRDCVTADCNAETLSITPRGRDALAFFGQPEAGNMRVMRYRTCLDCHHPLTPADRQAPVCPYCGCV